MTMSARSHYHCLVISLLVCTTLQERVDVGAPAPRALDRGPDSMETIIEQNEELFEEIASGKLNPFIIDSDIYDPTANETRTKRNAITDRRRLWPGGVVPFIIDGYFSSDDRMYILSAMHRFHEKTCIKFRPRTIERDYISITEGDGCWSMIGRRGGRQTVSLGGTCKSSRGTIIHELMHALGFRHEHNRPDRDNYVVLYWDNIDQKMWSNFAKYSRRDVTLLDTGYDYLSLMHYPTYAFSKNGGQTIGPRYATYEEPGTRNDFSYVDVYRITALYRCGACYDTDKENCPTWAIMGECRRSSVWMHKYCPYSCETCNKADYGGGDCRDYSNGCEEWSSTGECDRNPDFMSYNCKMSCGYCKSPHDVHSRKECYDESSLCSEWQQLGECYNNPEYMKKTCRKSCGVCQETDRDYDIGDGECRDLHPLCHIWARHDVCESYNEWMIENCALSCWRCANKSGVFDERMNDTSHKKDVGSSRKQYRRQICRNTERKCAKWADAGRCTREPDFMYARCLKSCGMCIDERVRGIKGSSARCEDRYSLCDKWSKDGDCDHDEEWMKVKCPISCGYCHVATVPTTASVSRRPHCVDILSSCPFWAESGECDVATAYMRKNCKRSCRVCGGDVQVVQQGCTDVYKRCSAWAAAGECETNPGWLHANCRKSCDRCHERKTTSETCVPKPSLGACNPACEDRYRRCKRLADSGTCDGDQTGWMRTNCPLSCGFCGVYNRRRAPDPLLVNFTTSQQFNDTGGDCRDYHPHCPIWSKTGNCRVNLQYMRAHCRKSCGYCPTCFDKSPDCQIWAKRGDCLQNPAGLKKQCAMSCGNCGRGPKACIDTHKQCAKWAKRGYCPTHSKFMHKFCKVSCDACNIEEPTTPEPPKKKPRSKTPKKKTGKGQGAAPTTRKKRPRQPTTTTTNPRKKVVKKKPRKKQARQHADVALD